MTLKSDAKLEGELTFFSKKDMRNLVNFNSSCGTSEKLHFYRKFVIIQLKKMKNEK